MTSEYILGSGDHELARLALQQEVWRENTSDFLDHLGVRPGARVVDLGCGPGHVVAMLRERVGPGGEILAVDEAPRWVDHVEARARAEGWSNVRVVRSRIQDLALEEGSVELLFMRWVLAFLPEREALLRRLARFLVPGGMLAVMDYNHEGVSIFPRSSGFDATIRATRAFYETRGGDTFVMGDAQRLFRAAELEPTLLRCYVISGGPASPAMRWADAFFPYHVDGMVDAGVMSREERILFLSEWTARLSDPDALFFSPIVVGAAARKAGTPEPSTMAELSLQDRYAPDNCCFGCGPKNERGLRIKSFVRGEAVLCTWMPEVHHEAFTGMLNGGICGTLLDCHSNWTAAHHLMSKNGLDVPPCTVTAEFHVKLVKPTPTSGPIDLRARVIEATHRRAVVEATLEAGGVVTASCRGVFVAVKEDHPAHHRW